MKIDWEQQWELFAPNYRNGFAHIDLQNGKTLRLKAGPGFGNLSHPTTRLCLALLQEKVRAGDTVLDIGCGSGVLSLAAALLGASRVTGLDIDPEALKHARLNLKSNPNSSQVSFIQRLPSTTRSPQIILMNMIQLEQRAAWNYRFSSSLLVTSGVLATQRAEYLAFATSNGWTLLEEHQEEEWLAFVFSI